MDTNKLILESFNKALELVGQSIKIMDKDKNIKANTKAIVKAERVQNQDSNYFISVGDIYKITTLQKTNIGDLISFKNKQYKVESVDDTTPLYVSYCKYGGIDIVYNIILAETTATINKDNTYQITATAHENGVIIENPTIIYTSSNSAIATVNETGLVTGISEGECTITCNYNGVSATLTVNVIVQVIFFKEFKIIGSETIAVNKEEIYKIVNKDGSVVDSSKNYNFEISDSSVCTMTEQGKNYCKLKALKRDEVCILTATDIDFIDKKAQFLVGTTRY